MKRTYSRRYRPRSSVSCEGKKNCHENFFGDPEQDRFFQPSIYSTQEGTIHRKCAECEKEEKQVHRTEDKKEEKPVQRMATAGCAPMSMGGVSRYIGSLPGRGAPLPAPARRFFEARMGHDFSGVRVHTGEEAARSAKAVRAKAYTTGNDIVFNEGQYDVSSGEGKKLLAHELTHVMQQDERVQRSPAKPYLKQKGITPQQTIDSDEGKMRAHAVAALGNPDSRLNKYIGPKLAGLKDPKVTKIYILTNSEFGDAYLPYAKKYGDEKNADPSVKSDQRALDVGGFYDPATGAVYVRLRGTFCHFFHETMHSFSNPDFLRKHVGGHIKEGLTQYFTDVVFDEQLGANAPCKSVKEYEQYKQCAADLVQRCGEDTMAELFFNSSADALSKIALKLGLDDDTALENHANDSLCTFAKDPRRPKPPAPPAKPAPPNNPPTTPARPGK